MRFQIVAIPRVGVEGYYYAINDRARREIVRWQTGDPLLFATYADAAEQAVDMNGIMR